MHGIHKNTGRTGPADRCPARAASLATPTSGLGRKNVRDHRRERGASQGQDPGPEYAGGHGAHHGVRTEHTLHPRARGRRMDHHRRRHSRYWERNHDSGGGIRRTETWIAGSGSIHRSGVAQHLDDRVSSSDALQTAALPGTARTRRILLPNRQRSAGVHRHPLVQPPALAQEARQRKYRRRGRRPGTLPGHGRPRVTGRATTQLPWARLLHLILRNRACRQRKRHVDSKPTAGASARHARSPRV